MATIPGQMSTYDIQARTLHLLREPGPDTGESAIGTIPATGDFSAATLLRDANIWLGSFIGEAGMAPTLSDVVATLGITAGLDYALPANLAALQQVDYTPAGGQTYTLNGYGLTEFLNVTGNVVPLSTGQPLYYREPMNNAIRLIPAPNYSNAGLATGSVIIAGTPVAGNTLSLALVNGATHVTVGPYTVLSTDTTSSIALALAALVNASAAGTGGAAFLSPCAVLSGTINLIALTAGTAGNAITYTGTRTGTGVTISPTVTTNFAGGGTADTITLYYTSLGSILVNATDVPGIPAQFHMAICYGMLSEYWARKNDQGQARIYEQKYLRRLDRAKAHVFDQNRSSQPSISGYGDDDGDPWPVGGG